jgi:uncharacterized protein with von Willebrand factor type A (vWA) domain
MTAVRAPLVDRLHRFIDELRARGLPVSMVERIDAMQAAEGAELDTRLGLHTVLSATLVKTAEHLSVFDEVFELYFRLARPATTELVGDTKPVAAEDGRTPMDLDRALRSVLRDGSDALARLVAEQAVAQFGRFEAGRPAAGVMYEKWTVEGLRLAQVSAELARQAAAGEGNAPGTGPGGGPNSGPSSVGHQLGVDLRRHEIIERTEALRMQIREVIREMLIADRGVDAVAKTLRKPLTADIDISMASGSQLIEIERIMQPLQRKLATTMMRKRRQRTGPLDVRATLRASMATGGVPVRVIHRRPRPTKPQLYVLADMSGSVATFAAFTVTLVSAMSQLFSRLRTFAFIQDASEVTTLFKETKDPRQAVAAVTEFMGASSLGGYTDYGRSLRGFWGEIGTQLGRRSTVLIFGDARGNYLPAEEATLVKIAKRAGSVYWLNPEPRSLWGTGDSLMPVYERHCTEAVSCRTLSDLKRFIESLD